MKVARRPKAKPARKKPQKAESAVKAGARAVAEPLDRHGELVRATFQLIAEKGLEGLRTRDIAAAVGVNIATLHYYFATKEALVAAVVDYATSLFATLHAPLPADATPLDELRHLFASYAYRRRVNSQVDVVVQEILLRSRRDEEVRVAFETMLGHWRAAVADIVARGVRQKQLRADVQPRVVAAIITSYLIGANQLGIAPATLSPAEAADHFIAWLTPKR